MAQSIKLSDSTMQELRNAAPVHSRSISGQAEHWIKLGKAFERSNNYDFSRIESALAGETSPDDLSAEEQELFFELFVNEMIESPQPISDTEWQQFIDHPVK